MHILYYHQHFVTPDGAGGTRSYAMARRLIERGHRVTMVCGSYSGANIKLQSKPKRGIKKGNIDGIDVIEFCLPYSNYGSSWKRVSAFLQFAIKSSIISLTYNYDMLFATSTPLTAGIPGILAHFLRRKPFVFEVRDLWPKLPREMGIIKNPVILQAMDILEWLCYHSADACIGLSPGIVKGIKQKGIDQKNVVMVPNGCDIELFDQKVCDPFFIDGVKPDDFNAIFTGTHGTANGLHSVLDAAGELKKRGRRNINLILVGDGKLKPELKKRASMEMLDNCIFLNPISKKQLVHLLKRAHVGMMILANIPAFYDGTSPNKFFDYIAAGLPVLNNYPGWLADMITVNKCGIVVPPENPKEFANALEYFADHTDEVATMGEHAHVLAKRLFARRNLADKLVDTIEKVAACRLKEFTDAK
ncbi:MAG: glycosyltransferase family 4 protein [Candidatus Orphnella occulta]|nr:glycosyltransferase family 4 protein [Candidatus Orphnella occulta]